MCEAALGYARRGWAVFPCRERDHVVVVRGAERTFKAKAPYTRAGLKDATTDERQILAWWREHPDALIGLPAGAAWFVLDFDPRTDQATGEVWTLERLKAELEAQMGCALPRSLTAMTQSDGVHVYFRQPAGDPIRNRGNLPDHVDVRGLGGYVVAPPSVMGETGARYRWLDRGDWRDDQALADAPEELVRILRERKASKPKAGDRPRPFSPPIAGDVDADVRKYALSALDGECRDIQRAGSGQRNAKLNEAAFKVATLVAAGALSAGVARASLEDAARANPGNDDDQQLLATIDSGWTAGLASPRDLGEVAAASRSRRERGPPRRSSRSSPPAPVSDDDGQPSSHAGGAALEVGRKGSGDEEEAKLTRECAFLPHTDLGNAERFLKRFGRDFLFVEAWGWLAWDGRRWNRESAMALLGRAAQDTMRAIQDEAELIHSTGVPTDPLPLYDAEQVRAHEEQQKGKLDRVVKVARDGTVTLLSDTIAKWGRTSEGAGHIKSIFTMVDARLAARPDDFDADPLLLNCQNGTLVFARPADGKPATCSRRSARREDRITKLAAVVADSDALCPKFDAFLEQVQPEADMRHFLDVWAGYGSLGLADAQKMALFYGQGSNGKGVWVNLIATILGDYAWAAGIETFIDQGKYRKGSEATTDLAALVGRRFVYANEPEDGSKFSDGLIKAMTSDEPIGGVRELFKPPFQLPVTFNNTVSANNRPKIGTDHGIQRRMQVVPWDVIIPADQQDLQLKVKLKAEASGVLNRMIRGALAYLTSGLPTPEAIKAATREYQEENDLLGQFLALCVERSPGATLGASALHQLFAAWQTWAQLLPATGKPWSPKYLNVQMQRKGYSVRKSSSMVWDDIAARYEPHDFTDTDGRAVTRDLPPPRTSGGIEPGPLRDDDDDIAP